MRAPRRHFLFGSLAAAASLQARPARSANDTVTVGFMGLRGGSKTTLTICMAVATVLAIAAVSGQIRFMGHLPFTTGDGSFASTYILLSGYHIWGHPPRAAWTL